MEKESKSANIPIKPEENGERKKPWEKPELRVVEIEDTEAESDRLNQNGVLLGTFS